MKIALLHGAMKNAGDFLILERTKELLRHFYPKCVISEFYRNKSMEEHLCDINHHDVMMIAGGPGYCGEYYPEYIPLVEDLNRIKIPIVMLGMGWFGVDSTVHHIYRYGLGEKMKLLLERVSSDTKILGCRDYYSANILRNSGFDNSLMTGCPAWYYLECLDQTSYVGKPLHKMEKIVISDCRDPNNMKSALELIGCIKNLFPNIEIQYIFHRGLDDVDDAMINGLNQYGVEYQDISGSAEGFSVYDDCDMHIGFRVHAHIYNLSKRKLSILIEEDGRGAGVNSALGLPSITPYCITIKNDAILHHKNEYLYYQIEDYLMNLGTNNYIPISNAFGLMKQYYSQMAMHIKSIEKYI